MGKSKIHGYVENKKLKIWWITKYWSGHYDTDLKKRKKNDDTGTCI